MRYSRNSHNNFTFTFYFQFPGVTDFLFTFDEILTAYEEGVDRNDLANKELLVVSEVYDWFLIQSASGKAVSVIYDNIVRLELLGDSARTFKPNQTLDVYVNTE